MHNTQYNPPSDPVSSNRERGFTRRRRIMAKSKPGSHAISLFVLLVFVHLSPILCELDGDRVEELRHLQERSPSGVIHLDDASLQRFAVKPKSRSYSLVIFFDALQLRDKSELRLDELHSEFELVARTYIQNNRDQDSANKVFFCDIEFQRSQASFSLFGVNALPHLRHVGPGHSNLKDSDVMDQSELTRTAESMAAFVESKTKQRVGPIERPPPISKKQLVFVAGVLLLAAPFVVKKLLTQDTPLHEPKRDSMTHSDFAATISVLLGFAPFTSDSTLSSSKLDGLLLPNPFDRPRAVFMLDARGISEELLSEVGLLKLGLDAYSYRTLIESNRVAIELPEDEVILESLNKASDAECGATCIDQELVDLASWLGGSYVGAQEPLHGKLDIPVSEGSFLSLDLSKRADQTFATELVSLLRNIRSAVAMHEDLAESSENPAELLMGSFVGVEALQEQYGPGDICLKGSELFLNVAVKLFRSLQLQYGGQIAGVIAINGNVFPASEGMFDIKLSLRGSRWLTELGPSTSPTRSNSTLAEIKLVRNSLAWSTAIILLIAALIGVYYLFNMPLTRDTLLYSNVKLD